TLTHSLTCSLSLSLSLSLVRKVKWVLMGIYLSGLNPFFTSQLVIVIVCVRVCVCVCVCVCECVCVCVCVSGVRVPRVLRLGGFYCLWLECVDRNHITRRP